MDTLQQQIGNLTVKVDTLHQLVELLSDRISVVISDCQSKSNGLYPTHHSRASYAYMMGQGSLDAAMEHKDILVDSNGLDVALQGSEKQLSPEIQVQRLTAQLTAAYSRIAALEEQLFSQRVL